MLALSPKQLLNCCCSSKHELFIARLSVCKHRTFILMSRLSVFLTPRVTVWFQIKHGTSRSVY